MKLTALLPFVTALLPLAVAEDLQYCGEARFYPSKYSCFGTLLCPKTETGEATIACGTACYDAGTYYCNSNTQLQLITPDAAVQYCGTAPYRPGEYTCWNGNFLCPVLNGEATLACGGTACYNPREYSCTDGKLGQPAEVPPPTCGGLYGALPFLRKRIRGFASETDERTATCGYNGNLPCCSDKYFCAASKCRPFNPPKMVKKSVL
ncbi:hypothetical protein E8E12_011777 [Didymella heteroderae]|uniref:Endo-1,3(4)-beta-glucanase 1 carbohydrate binding domain-containing protein n=1 Tax=Didymella heteroderae TaxID=1769908 RepID=A0A9P5C5P8_9PLEO|nr:hypothetical protein E8E12_011777 [Didymella heteroderae]